MGDQATVTAGLAAAASSPACSEVLAELSPATGFMTSSRDATRAPDTYDAGAYAPGEAPESQDPGGDAFVGGNDDGGQGASWDEPAGDTGGDWGGGDGGGDWGGGGGDWGGGGGDGGGW